MGQKPRHLNRDKIQRQDGFVIILAFARRCVPAAERQFSARYGVTDSRTRRFSGAVLMVGSVFKSILLWTGYQKLPRPNNEDSTDPYHSERVPID
jgi:hypothetical protein